ncbi:MAG: FkbM family methyltransferase [Rhodobacterales bacterium]|nr:FkbM family methyltransferase [Rhodobacterales bacterium]
MTISYAQNFEDVILWRALKHVSSGFYIDVGAWSPDLHSVTRLFYEAGWRGINIEPLPKMLDALRARRPEDINIGVALSNVVGVQKFHNIGETGLSTLSSDEARRAFDAIGSDCVINVEVMTLANIWETHVPPGQPVHFLKIDVEGSEENVIRGGDWKRHRPWIVVIESTITQSSIENHHGWDPILSEAGYNFVWFDGLNRFYVAVEHADLNQAFNAPPNVFDGFRRVEEVEFESRAHLAEEQLKALESRAHLAEEQLKIKVVEVAALEKSLAELRNQIDIELVPLKKYAVEAEWAHKPLWIRLLFRSSGKPKKLLRRALFHTSGKPRGIFRSLVLHPDGRPHSLFRQWMFSREYQNLRAAVRLEGTGPTGPVMLSPDGERIARRVAALRTHSLDKG